MLSASLEKTLHRALAYANDRRHEYATLEHLLLSLSEDTDAVAVLRACGVDLDRLRGDIQDYIDNELSNLITAQLGDAKPTAKPTKRRWRVLGLLRGLPPKRGDRLTKNHDGGGAAA